MGIITTPSDNSAKFTNPWRRYSDSPPNYDATEAEPHGFIDGKAARESPFQTTHKPLVSGGPLSKDLITQDGVERDLKTPLFLDPTTDEPCVAYAVPGELLDKCTQFGHVKKTKFGTCSILVAAVFFPVGLLCMMGSRVVYCERCRLVLRGSPKCKGVHTEHSHK
ncbi:hypothetical protein BDM02DRAFT_1881558 [Thelephora ganbajun]|uniref:Uncharacterized protein n=1 Tax=Thelephora ganbajun TaxID=370292 RepID=A0ACB6ZV36_THEGA|nr:hypothetical protein BDM02DRAFT_1881558 [Thelephora ganbajun]